jgi:hypothetical protein
MELVVLWAGSGFVGCLGEGSRGRTGEREAKKRGEKHKPDCRMCLPLRLAAQHLRGQQEGGQTEMAMRVHRMEHRG